MTDPMANNGRHTQKGANNKFSSGALLGVLALVIAVLTHGIIYELTHETHRDIVSQTAGALAFFVCMFLLSLARLCRPQVACNCDGHIPNENQTDGRVKPDPEVVDNDSYAQFRPDYPQPGPGDPAFQPKFMGSQDLGGHH